MRKIINEVEKIVKNKADKLDWNYHIKPALKYALLLSKKYKIDRQQVILAALLHDIGRLPFSDKKDKNHHITGAKEAEKILKKFNYPTDKIDKVVNAVLCHRGSTFIKPRTMLDKIIANADAMSHFDMMPAFYYTRASRYSIEEITRWLEDKYKRNWNKKLTLPEAKRLAKEKYLLNKKVLKNLKIVIETKNS